MCSTGCNLKVGGGFPLRPLTHCLLQYCSLGTWRRRSLCQPSISYQVVGTISKTTQWAAWWIIRHQLQSIAFRCLRKFDTYRQGAWQSAARRRRREEANKIYFFQKRVWSMDYCKVRQREKKKHMWNLDNAENTLPILDRNAQSLGRQHAPENVFPPNRHGGSCQFFTFPTCVRCHIARIPHCRSSQPPTPPERDLITTYHWWWGKVLHFNAKKNTD